MTTATLTVEEILNGTSLGRTQSVGLMEVIPIIDMGSASDETFGPPDISVGTSHYGSVDVQNDDRERPTIVPTGAGWVTAQAAQDHAIPSAKLMKAGGKAHIDTAMCIEETQGGLIRGAKDFLVLPASLRSAALSKRHDRGYDKLWNAIGRFNTEAGVSHGRGHLVRFLKQYETELDQFVAEFEMVPGQIGAMILMNGQVVGIERVPNVAFWERLWEPLVRVCYGSLAIKVSRELGKMGNTGLVPPTRVPMNVQTRSLEGIKSALRDARDESDRLVEAAVDAVRDMPLILAGAADDSLGKAQLITVANTRYAGQMVTNDGRTSYASLCAAGA